jgi:hypothetical protein
MLCLLDIQTRTRTANSGFGEDLQGVGKSPISEIEDVIVGQGTNMRSDRSQTTDVARMHPVVNRLAGREFTTGGDAGFQIEQADIGLDVVQEMRCLSPWPAEVDRSRNTAVGLLGEPNVGSGIGHNGFPKSRISGMGQYLVDSATGHHVAGEKDEHIGSRARGHGRQRVPASARSATDSMFDSSTNAGPVSVGSPPPITFPFVRYSHNESTARYP